MEAAFYIAGGVAVLATAMVITRLHPVHALLYLIVSLLATAVAFFTLGAPFAAALEVIIYAGAIMVVFVFAVMLLNLGPETVQQERAWLSPGMFAGPSALAAVLLAEFIMLPSLGGSNWGLEAVGPKEVGASMFTTYLLGVELAAMLLLGGLVGAFHIGRHDPRVSATVDEEAREMETPAGGRE